MHFAGALSLAFLLATTVSASRNVLQPQPDVKNAGVAHKALLGRKATTKVGCKVGDPKCVEQITLVLEVNAVLKATDAIESKAEEAEVEAQKLTEQASKVEASKKEEQSAVAAEIATEEEKTNTVEAVKNEDVELRESKQALEAEEQAVKKIPNPAAAAIVIKDEEKLKSDVQAQEVEKEVKEEEVKVVTQKEQISEMKVATTEAQVSAEVNKFKVEKKALKEMETKLLSPKDLYKGEMKVYKLQTKVVKDTAAKPVDPKTATVAELVKAAEVPKVQLATEKMQKAKAEVQEAKVEEKKAEAKINEVVKEAETAKEVQEITKKFGSVEEVKEKIKECKPCPTSPVVPAAPALPKCEMWDFVGLPNSDLMAIKMGPTTGTKMTEVHTLGKSSNYKNWALQTGTGLHLTDGSLGSEWDFVALPNSDLMGIKMSKTQSKKTEVHILSKSSNYAKFALHAATGLELTTQKQWDFAAAPNGDLMCIKKGPTGSGKTEVHILSKSSNYAKFALHAASGLELTDGATEWDFQAMPNGDLMCIKMGPTTGSSKTEVHILSKSSNYAKFVLHAATGLELTTHKAWSFATLPNGDLMCIKKGPTSGTSKTEVHVLGKSSNYKNFVLQTGTGLALTVDPPGTCSA
jgi:hypothetical protein